MKNIKSLFFDSDGFVAHGTFLYYIDENNDATHLFRKRSKEIDMIYFRDNFTNPRIMKLLVCYEQYLKKLNPNTFYLNLYEATSSKIYHNLGRLSVDKIDKLINNPELLYKLLQMNKVECLKYLKDLSL